jgi:CopG family transcriptional regulator, nickel-responsive regulator
MQRVTVTLEDELLIELDQMVVTRGYQNRSEAVRDLARAALRQAAEEANTSRECIAALVYVYDHETRELSKRLTKSFHDHHDLSLATLHVHLDHESCMEVTVLRGPTQSVKHFADNVIAERGVRHGRLSIIPAELKSEKHAHGGERDRKHLHSHVRDAG